MSRVWNMNLHRYDDGSIAALIKARVNDDGASWIWTPITQNSTRDNMRPIVPLWDASY